MHKVAIIGAGNFGAAIAGILANKPDIEIAMWDIDPVKVSNMKPLEDVVQGADCIFVCVSSWALRKACESILPYASPDAVIISPTKGIEAGTLKTSDEILQDVFGENAHIALMHGPMLAAEIMQGLPAFTVLAAKDVSAYNQVKTLFEDTALSIEYSSDVHGIALAGVLKNIYSIGLGMADAMLLGSNFRGYFVRVAVQEMADIIVAFAGKSETARTSAGIADLIATGFSPLSRNCKVGHEIVQSGECITVSEGAESLPQMVALLGAKNISAPLCRGIADIMSGVRPARSIDKIVTSCV